MKYLISILYSDKYGNQGEWQFKRERKRVRGDWINQEEVLGGRTIVPRIICLRNVHLKKIPLYAIYIWDHYIHMHAICDY